jgi:hypothetical protein
LVVTSHQDRPTQRLATATPRVRCLTTDAFYRGSRPFNKGLAVEEGFDALGRRGWILVIDADIVLPRSMPLPALHRDTLYSPFRRIWDVTPEMLESPEVVVPEEATWSQFPRGPEGTRNEEFAGYFQLFHAEAEPIRGRYPWYGLGWPTAGGCDSEFWWKFQHTHRLEAFEVLHLGRPFANWHGVPPRTTITEDETG